MMSATAEQQSGSSGSHRGARRLKLWIAIGLVFATQVAVLYWLGNPPLAKPRPVATVPVVHMAGTGSRELLALQDPTLFVLPHRENFSGPAWLNVAPREFSATNWTEPARPMELSTQSLGAAFVAFIQTNTPPRFQPRIESGLDTAEAAAPPMPPISMPSRLRVEGDLARLRLLTHIHLPPQTNSDLLSNTVVQVVVDSNGHPFSSVLWAGSGSQDADLMALTNYSKAVRFAPLEAAALRTVPADKMISGRLIFEWQTVPSNAPPAIP
jgi:hypothetical protein